jgi:hypothetical protein
MPLGVLRERFGIDLGTTSGTCGSLRQAELLSITSAPTAATFGASASEVEPPAEKKTISSPAKSAVAASSTVISPPAQGRMRARRPGRREQAQA